MLDSNDLALVMELFPVFAQLPGRLVDEVRVSAVRRDARPDESLLGEMSPPDRFMMLIRGAADVRCRSHSGRTLPVHVMEQGQACGLVAVRLIAGGECLFVSVVARSACSAIFVSREMFLRLVDESALFRAYVMGIVAGRFVQALERVSHAASAPLQQHIASALIGNGNVVRITHAALATQVGSERGHVSRALRRMARQRMIRLGRSRIELLDPNALQTLAWRGQPGNQT